MVGHGAGPLHYVEFVGALVAYLLDLGEEAGGAVRVHGGAGVGVAVDEGAGDDLVGVFGGDEHLRAGLDAGQAGDDLLAFFDYVLGDVGRGVAQGDGHAVAVRGWRGRDE